MSTIMQTVNKENVKYNISKKLKCLKNAFYKLILLLFLDQRYLTSDPMLHWIVEPCNIYFIHQRWDLWCIEDWEEKDDLISEWIN